MINRTYCPDNPPKINSILLKDHHHINQLYSEIYWRQYSQWPDDLQLILFRLFDNSDIADSRY